MTRLATALSFVLALASCSPSRAELAEREHAAAAKVAASASAAASAAAYAAARAREAELMQPLSTEPDEATRAKLAAELAKAQAAHHGSGKKSPCKCQRGDPLCSCW